jgi:hypothetical protein
MGEMECTSIEKNLVSINKKKTPTIVLCKPKNAEEQCSITLDFIGDSPPSLNYVPLSAHPQLNCIQIKECGHRFNAMSLLAHFSRHNMTCPMCRYGLGDSRMDISLSFPGESWVMPFIQNFALQDCIISLDEDDSDSDNGGETSSAIVIPLLNNSGNFGMFATFWMYNSIYPPVDSTGNHNERPCISVECQLESDNRHNNNNRSTQADNFRMPNSFARHVSEIINDMDIRSISAIIYIKPSSIDLNIPVASMHRTSLSNADHATVSPDIHTISFNVNVDRISEMAEISSFTFTPANVAAAMLVD